MKFGIENEARFSLHGYSIDYIAERVRIEAAWATGAEFKGFTASGGKIYRDRVVEFCTPECETPAEAVLYNNANRQLLHYALGKTLCEGNAVNPIAHSAWHYNRVIDSKHNTWGLHDNYGLSQLQHRILSYALASADSSLHPSSPVARFLCLFVGTRIIYTGAGCVDDTGFHFSQKRNCSYNSVAGRCYGNTLFSLVDAEGRGTNRRFESRDNDNPWSDWSSTTRLAAMAGAIGLATSSYPLQELEQPVLDNYIVPSQYNALNRFNINREGFLTSKRSAVVAASNFQLQVLDVLHDQAEKYGIEVTPEMMQTYEGLYEYLELFKEVVRCRRPVADLCWYVDWAIKAELVRHKLLRDNQPPKALATNLEIAKAVDVAFDTTTFKMTSESVASPQPKLEVKPAVGQHLRETGRLGYMPDVAMEARAMTTPPSTGPAANRVAAILRHGGVDLDNINWTRAEVLDRPVDEDGVKVVRLVYF